MADYPLTNDAADVDLYIQSVGEARDAASDDTTDKRLLKVADFGAGSPTEVSTGSALDPSRVTGFYQYTGALSDLPEGQAGQSIVINRGLGASGSEGFQLFSSQTNSKYYLATQMSGSYSDFFEIWTESNTTVDGSGFIKEASPIVKLHTDSSEKNNLVNDSVTAKKLAVGTWEISNAEFAKTGWYIENIKDANGNVKVHLDYSESNGVITINVSTPDYSNGYCSAGVPCDIPDNRFITVRLHQEITEEE
jgi:hypothetical protein